MLYSKIPTYRATYEVRGTELNLNNLTGAGWRDVLIRGDNVNSPGFTGYLLVLNWHTNLSITQVVFGYTDLKIAIRYRYDNVWSSWKVFQ